MKLRAVDTTQFHDSFVQGTNERRYCKWLRNLRVADILVRQSAPKHASMYCTAVCSQGRMLQTAHFLHFKQSQLLTYVTGSQGVDRGKYVAGCKTSPITYGYIRHHPSRKKVSAFQFS